MVKRLLRHWLAPQRQVERCFPPTALVAIEQAIRASETRHLGEIRFVVESALGSIELLRGMTARERALEVFSQLRVWDTEHNNGVLIFLLLADREVEIIADRGIDTHVSEIEWARICHEMEGHFARGDHLAGILAGIHGVEMHLLRHYPASGANLNELTDQPTVL